MLKSKYTHSAAIGLSGQLVNCKLKLKMHQQVKRIIGMIKEKQNETA